MSMGNESKLDIIHVLGEYARRTDEIIDRISDRSSVSGAEKDELQALYSSLKEELTEVAKRGKVSAARQEQTDWERCYFAPAVTKAANSLRAKTNSHPINSNWMGSLLDASGEFSYYLFQLEKDRPEDQ
jgi:hypothetical protein